MLPKFAKLANAADAADASRATDADGIGLKLGDNDREQWAASGYASGLTNGLLQLDDAVDNVDDVADVQLQGGGGGGGGRATRGQGRSSSCSWRTRSVGLTPSVYALAVANRYLRLVPAYAVMLCFFVYVAPTRNQATIRPSHRPTLPNRV